MKATIAILSIEDERNGEFTANVEIDTLELGSMTLRVTVEAASYGEVPKAVKSRLADLGNAIAAAAYGG